MSTGFPVPEGMIIEMAHFQNYFMHPLPSLTDFGKAKDDSKIVAFLKDFVCTSSKKKTGY